MNPEGIETLALRRAAEVRALVEAAKAVVKMNTKHRLLRLEAALAALEETMTDMSGEIWGINGKRAAFVRADVVEARIAEAVAKEREAIAAMIEGSVYTNNGDKRSLQPVRPPFVAGSDTHHATIAAAIRSRT